MSWDVAYTVMLVVHSYLRWLVLLAGLVVVARSVRGWLGARAFVPVDNRAQVAFMSLLDLQMLVGLVLYAGLSPVTTAFFADPKAGMKDAAVRFFGVEHLVIMLVGVVLVHVGRVLGKKRRSDLARHKLTAATTIVWLVLTLGAIPWPGMAAGRPLLR